ncbi:Calmodulin [Echinococcus granulosus]|nr:Calmodulin [Echinococcus granulosus]
MIDPELENIDAKIFEAFDLFDHERNKTVDSRELGTIVRSLGLCPSEADLVKLTAKVWYSVLPEDEIVKAFRVFDPEKTGVVDADVLEEHLMREGEKFTRDEMDEMLASAIDVQKNGINYREIFSEHNSIPSISSFRITTKLAVYCPV